MFQASKVPQVGRENVLQTDKVEGRGRNLAAINGLNDLRWCAESSSFRLTTSLLTLVWHVKLVKIRSANSGEAPPSTPAGVVRAIYDRIGLPTRDASSNASASLKHPYFFGEECEPGRFFSKASGKPMADYATGRYSVGRAGTGFRRKGPYAPGYWRFR